MDRKPFADLTNRPKTNRKRGRRKVMSDEDLSWRPIAEKQGRFLVYCDMKYRKDSEPEAGYRYWRCRNDRANRPCLGRVVTIDWRDTIRVTKTKDHTCGEGSFNRCAADIQE